MAGRNSSCGRAAERGFADQHLVEHAPEAVDVSPAIEVPLAGRLFRTNVGRCADCETGFCHPLDARSLNRSRHPKVGYQRLIVGEQMFSGLMSR